jgi:ABC-type uncharacterized transport system substrate-binding protein
MRRRDFIKVIAGSAIAAPLVARAQQPPMPVIGFLHSASPDAFSYLLAAFRRGLAEFGLVEGRSVTIETRWAEGNNDRLPELAADLVRRQVAVIVAGGGSRTSRAAKSATATIPIIFAIGTDPVKEGLVASLNRPGGNITGITQLTLGLEPKRLELLRELLPNAALIALLVNPTISEYESQVGDIQAAARLMGLQVLVLNATTEQDFDTVFATIVKQRASGLLIGSDVFLFSRREQLVALATHHAVPTISQWREFALLGGLMSYGTDLVAAYQQLGIYAGRILHGEQPAELPVMQSTKVELVINMKTAKALGLTFPITILGRADEVIE